MLTEKEVQKICYDELSQLGLKSGCDKFIHEIASGNNARASTTLQEIIHLSITRCVHATLKANSK